MGSNFASVNDAPVVKMAESYSDPVQRFRTLAAIYNTDHDPKTRKQAWNEIERFSRNPDTLKVVIGLCVHYPDAVIRTLASKVLDELPRSRDVVQFLTELSQSDPDENVRKFAREKMVQVVMNSITHNSKEVTSHFQTRSALVDRKSVV